MHTGKTVSVALRRYYTEPRARMQAFFVHCTIIIFIDH
jgi:hypothetical protein